jgi:hypothetical protein
MSVTYTDQIRPAAARVDSEAYVPVYARSSARKSNKPVKTWMILAPLGALVVAGAAATMLMQPAAPVAEEPVPFAPLAAQLAASEVAPLNAPSIPMETPAELTTAVPIPPPAVAPVERRAAPAARAPAQVQAARVAPRACAGSGRGAGRNHGSAALYVGRAPDGRACEPRPGGACHVGDHARADRDHPAQLIGAIAPKERPGSRRAFFVRGGRRA